LFTTFLNMNGDIRFKPFVYDHVGLAKLMRSLRVKCLM
jgi:hypothetical protein